MGRKKTSVTNKTEEMRYCKDRHCPYERCLRHKVNTPFGVKIWVSSEFKRDKDGNCKDIMED